MDDDDQDLFPGMSTAPALGLPADGDIVHSDALDILAGLAAGTASLIVTDPPYGIAYHSNYYRGRNPHAPISQDWDFQIGAFFAEASRALVDGGAIYLFTRWDVYPLWYKEIPKALSLKNAIVWKKDNWSSGDLYGNFGNQYEIVMFLTKGRHSLRGKRWPNIWEFPRIPAKRLRMPAEKPVGLYERAILSSSDKGDLVVDPFCGSGTAAEAARRAGRRFLLGDIDPKMVSMARERVGLSTPTVQDEPGRKAPPCPVFSVEPPDISLWGLHPEDVLHSRTGR
jgi:site-specific DNA-methyltransferase (adenine-specific)